MPVGLSWDFIAATFGLYLGVVVAVAAARASAAGCSKPPMSSRVVTTADNPASSSIVADTCCMVPTNARCGIRRRNVARPPEISASTSGSSLQYHLSAISMTSNAAVTTRVRRSGSSSSPARAIAATKGIFVLCTTSRWMTAKAAAMRATLARAAAEKVVGFAAAAMTPKLNVECTRANSVVPSAVAN